MRTFKVLVAAVGGPVVVLLLCAACVVLSTVGGIAWDKWVNQQQNSANYAVFNTSPQHVQAIVSRIAKDCSERALTQDKTERAAYDQDIYQAQSTIDPTEAQMDPETRACMNEAVHYEMHGGQP